MHRPRREHSNVTNSTYTGPKEAEKAGRYLLSL